MFVRQNNFTQNNVRHGSCPHEPLRAILPYNIFLRCFYFKNAYQRFAPILGYILNQRKFSRLPNLNFLQNDLFIIVTFK